MEIAVTTGRQDPKTIMGNENQGQALLNCATPSLEL